MTDVALALLAALPWLAVPVLVAVRMRRSRSLDEMPEAPPDDAPTVSIVVPARDEARNIGRCVRSMLGATYPALELVVVDDHSTDGTGRAAREAGAGDLRLRVIENPDLPAGWFGKQWACATGAAAARGEILLFADADTVHAPDLVTRAVHALRATGADLLSVSGRQELGSFWERAIQPQVFSILAGRYGGTEAVTNSPRVEDKIANGQCLMVRRAAYEAVGGHAAVRDKVAEDLALAQRFFAGGKRVAMFLGTAQLSTRMYTSLGELVRGWRKNVFAGGREAMPGGRVGRAVFPALLLLPPLFALVPVAALAAGLLGLASGTVLLWGALTTAAQLLWWAVVYRSMGQPMVYALAFPLGAAVLLGIMLQAIARGRRVEWKGRAYVAR